MSDVVQCTEQLGALIENIEKKTNVKKGPMQY